jgi:YD repeat-containing protein
VLERRNRGAVKIAVDASGSLYVSDSIENRVYFLAANLVGAPGVSFDDLVPVAGTGLNNRSVIYDQPAIDAHLTSPGAIAVDAAGNIVVAHLARLGFNDVPYISQIGTDGVIRPLAGGGDEPPLGVKAVDARLRATPFSIAFDASGGTYLAGRWSVLYLSPDGLINTVAGLPDSEAGGGELLQRGRRDRALKLEIGNAVGIVVTPSGEPIVGLSSGFRNGLVRLTGALPGLSLSDLLVAANGGSQLHRFSQGGLHLDTRDAVTGQVLHSFEYDQESRLLRMRYPNGRTLEIERDGNGAPVALVGPQGARVAIEVDAGGLLSRVTEADGRSTVLENDLVLNRLFRMTDRRGATWTFNHLQNGRFALETDPLGGEIRLTRNSDPDGRWAQVTKTLQTGLQTVYRWELPEAGGLELSTTRPHGSVSTVLQRPDGRTRTDLEDGTVVETTVTPDPRFGLQAPLSTTTLRLPSGRSIVRSQSRTIALAQPLNPLSVTTQTETFRSGTVVFTETTTVATRRSVLRLPSGAESSSEYDEQWRLARLNVAGTEPVEYSWNAVDELLQARQGQQFLAYEYDAFGRLSQVTDALGRSKGYEYDSSDRLNRIVLPSGAAMALAYDANDHLRAFSMPSGAVHRMEYSAVNLMTAYQDPLGNRSETDYDIARRRTALRMPSGAALANAFDAGGRIDTVSYPDTSISHDYVGNTEVLASVTRSQQGNDQSLAFDYDGFLVMGTTFSGAANGQFSYDYDANLRLNSLQLDGGPAVTSQFDIDSRLVGRGPFSYQRGGSGLVAGWSGAGMQVALERDGQGRMTRRSHSLGGSEVYRLELVYDEAGRLLQRRESVNGTTSGYDYLWDANESLLGVDVGGLPLYRYSYDVNGNRSSVNGTVATYDAADRVVQVGSTAYLHDVDGFLTQRGGDSFNYSMRGELLNASGGGVQVSYGHDGFMRRVSRTTSAGTTQYLYGHPTALFTLTHSRAPDGTLTTYHYDEAGLLIGFERDGAVYHVITDQVGSPRLILRCRRAPCAGNPLQPMGRGHCRQRPGFELVIGFAGGIADPARGWCGSACVITTRARVAGPRVTRRASGVDRTSTCTPPTIRCSTAIPSACGARVPRPLPGSAAGSRSAGRTASGHCAARSAPARAAA